MRALFLLAVAALAPACISPSVLSAEQRAPSLGDADVVWSPAGEADLPGTYVSVEITGSAAAVLRKLVYHFQPDGSYSGAALLDDVPPRFEVIGGTWRVEPDGLHLDDAPPALLERTDDGSLRLSGDEGRVVLRREEER